MQNKHLINLYIIQLFVCIFFLIVSCKQEQIPEITTGVSLQLAEYRKKIIDSLHYKLYFHIPPVKVEKVSGKAIVSITLNKKPEQLILDFNAPAENLISVKISDEKIDYQFIDEHIIISGQKLRKGLNQIEFIFISSDQALNRQNDFMYTLFVPDRASTAFPCFDQPDLKAIFDLELSTPMNWKSVSNGERISEKILEDKKISRFTLNKPIPSYLFSFATGVFDTISHEKNSRRITMYHRESDTEKLYRNKEAIFNQHFEAINWLEKYTGIPYPFGKFDFVAVPFFQYGGMEHPGAILYRASRLFLDENVSPGDILARANLIAHETAHMWFGDLVTMRWFNDVWMKEVFANFLADKIVNPMFPELNHRQRFLYAHFPKAYEIDRTQGANPIRQELNNMKNAGTLYGNIIYHKAPIMMNQLEKILGEENLRKGLQQYLTDFAYANADWPELISILDSLTEFNLKEWSKVWVDEPGMPTIDLQSISNNIFIVQTDPLDNRRLWNQILNITVATISDILYKEITLKDQKHKINMPVDDYHYILPDGSGEGYGYFRLDEISKDYLLNNLRNIEDPLLKAISILTLWEEMLNGRIKPFNLLETNLATLQEEADPLNSESLLQQIRTIYWRFLTNTERVELAEKLEEFLLGRLTQIQDKKLKNSYFRTFISVSGTKKGLKILQDIWSDKTKLNGVELSENDYIVLSLELAVKLPEMANYILEEQLKRITNPDRKDSYLFVMPALSREKYIRDDFFEQLKEPLNRKVEPRVLQAMEYLHHPLRSEESIEYIRPSLEMLEEIQLTGDIFFPTNWLNTTLGGYQNEAAKRIVEDFLNERPDYPVNLKGKILQSADMLYRAVEITKKSGTE